MRTFLHTFAVVLALCGQWAIALGVPIFQPPTANDDCAACGCCPADKEARICCCHPAPITPTTPTKPEPKPTCCHAEPAKPTHACCVEEVASTPEPLQWQWVGGVYTKQCRGPLDGVAVLGVAPAIPPALPTDRLNLPTPTFARPTAEHACTRAEQPPAPPPRSETLLMKRLLSQWGDVDGIQRRLGDCGRFSCVGC